MDNHTQQVVLETLAGNRTDTDMYGLLNSTYMMNRTINRTWSDNTDMTTSGEEITEIDKYFTLVTYSLMAILGVVFNVLTILIFLQGKRSSLRDIRILIINLAAVDIVYSISGTIPNAMELAEIDFPDNVTVCRMWRFTYIFSAYGSPLANLAIAIERFMIVFFPSSVVRFGRKNIMLIIIAVFWAFDFVVTGEYLVTPTLKQYQGVTVCRSNTWFGRNYPEEFSWLLFVKFCAPAIVIVILYGIIGVHLMALPRLQIKKNPTRQAPNPNKATHKV